MNVGVQEVGCCICLDRDGKNRPQNGDAFERRSELGIVESLDGRVASKMVGWYFREMFRWYILSSVFGSFWWGGTRAVILVQIRTWPLHLHIYFVASMSFTVYFILLHCHDDSITCINILKITFGYEIPLLVCLWFQPLWQSFWYDVSILSTCMTTPVLDKN